LLPAPITATAPLAVRYLLLNGNETRYTDMALAYRAYLERGGVLTDRQKGNNSIHLTLVGTLVKPSSFLGIPMNREITLTTFAQAGEILDALHETAGSAAVRYIGAQKGGYNSTWTRDYTFNGALGGQKKFEELVGTYQDDVIFLNGELMQVYKAGRGFSVSRDAARTTGNGVNFQYPYFLLDGTRDTDRKWYLLAPALWSDAFGRFCQSAHPSAPNLSIEDAGMMVSSEYEQNEPIYRDVTGPMRPETLRAAASSSANRLALTYGNAYTWGIADTLYHVPMGASGYFIQSGEVPFYQMVVHGYIEYSGEPQNLSADKTLSFLRSVEYGALPHYFGMYAPSGDLNRSVLAGMFSACYEDWLPDASRQAEQTADLFPLLAGSRMVDHRQVADGVFRTTYENCSVTVDYNTLSFTAER
jgi:hypothetical protein